MSISYKIERKYTWVKMVEGLRLMFYIQETLTDDWLQMIPSDSPGIALEDTENF